MMITLIPVFGFSPLLCDVAMLSNLCGILGPWRIGAFEYVFTMLCPTNAHKRHWQKIQVKDKIRQQRS
jgi:hypothetical protein